MPYGNLAEQAVQRFASRADMERHHCTIEEREEYEPYVERGAVIFAGVDYEAILRQAEQEADIIIWDGGNNDLPFYRPDYHIVVVDPHRPGHELRYHPGEANVRLADAIVVNKIDTADPAGVDTVMNNVRWLNPRAAVVRGASPLFVDDAAAIQGKRVLVIEDGPTLTYGEIATRLGAPGSARAVGQALGHNPWPLVVPCHRVLGAGNAMVGFSAHGGAVLKRRLLGIEGARLSDALSLFGD